MSTLCPICFGRQFRCGSTVLDRHRHRESYIAIVLTGAYEEAGDRGRHRVTAGQAILHGAFEAHLNRYSSFGAEVLNLALPPWTEPVHPVAQVEDPDQVVRSAEHDPRTAARLLLSMMRPLQSASLDWPDELAAALRLTPQLRLDRWARSHNLAEATVSRGFRRLYGVSPSAYRAQCKARLAWKLTTQGGTRLSSVGLEAGFCDQSHMTRGIRNLTGASPGAWRAEADRRVK